MLRKLALLFVGLLILLPSSGCFADRRPDRKMLPAGSAVIVIAPSTPSADDQASEAYGDWASYLNDYAATKSRSPALVRMSAARWRTLMKAPQPKEAYATVFLRRDQRALLYDGMILEPQVYQAGEAWITGRKVPSADLGLVEVKPIRR